MSSRKSKTKKPSLRDKHIFASKNTRESIINKASINNTPSPIASKKLSIFNKQSSNNQSRRSMYEINRIDKFESLEDSSDRVTEEQVITRFLEYFVDFNGQNISPQLKKIINVVRAIVQEPDLLLVEETALDYLKRDTSYFMWVLNEEVDQNSSILCILNSLDNVGVYDRFYLLEKGTTIKSGFPDIIKDYLETNRKKEHSNLKKLTNKRNDNAKIFTDDVSNLKIQSERKNDSVKDISLPAFYSYRGVGLIGGKKLDKLSKIECPED